jgi:hypothetical protein
MAYSPVGKFKNKKSNNESLLKHIRDSIDKEYRKATQSGDWNNYSFVYNAYYNYRLNGGNSYYIKAVVEKYKSQYERQQNQKNIEISQHDALLNITSVALDGTKDTITVSGGYGNKTLAEFGEQVDDACFLPIAEVVEGTKLDYHNTTETKHKTFGEMSYEEKIKSVNKQIDDLLDFIERNKQAKYNTWKKEFHNGSSKL